LSVAPSGRVEDAIPVRSIFVIAVMICLAATPAAAAVAVVLAVDVSASVTPESYMLQHDGIARAFENAQLDAAIAAAPAGSRFSSSNGRIPTR